MTIYKSYFNTLDLVTLVLVTWNRRKLFLLFLLFNDCHVLQLRPETVAVHRRMRNGLDDYNSQMVSGLNFLTFVVQLRENTGKNLNQKTDPTEI